MAKVKYFPEGCIKTNERNEPDIVNTAEKRLRMRHPYWNLPCEPGVKDVKCSEGCQKLKMLTS
jgi:hypothetical protein